MSGVVDACIDSGKLGIGQNPKFEARNPKHEIRDKSKARMTEIQNLVFPNSFVGEADFGVRPFDFAQGALSSTLRLRPEGSHSALSSWPKGSWPKGLPKGSVFNAAFTTHEVPPPRSAFRGRAPGTQGVRGAQYLSLGVRAWRRPMGPAGRVSHSDSAGR